MSEAANVTLETTDGLARLTLNRPGVLNAIDHRMLVDLDHACSEIETNREIRVVIISGAGSAFCAGADLAYVKRLVAEPGAFGTFLRYWHHVFNRIEDLPMPTIAAIHGYAFAGGLELALCCDMRILADTATVGDQHANYGLVPGGGNTQRLPRLIGHAKAKELILTGAWLTASEAERCGLANRIVPADQLTTAAMAIASTLLDKSPVAARAVKALINRGMQVELREGLEMEVAAAEQVMAGDDAAEGLVAFAEKRRPVFRGR